MNITKKRQRRRKIDRSICNCTKYAQNVNAVIQRVHINTTDRPHAFLKHRANRRITDEFIYEKFINS